MHLLFVVCDNLLCLSIGFSAADKPRDSATLLLHEPNSHQPSPTGNDAPAGRRRDPGPSRALDGGATHPFGKIPTPWTLKSSVEVDIAPVWYEHWCVSHPETMSRTSITVRNGSDPTPKRRGSGSEPYRFMGEQAASCCKPKGPQPTRNTLIRRFHSLAYNCNQHLIPYLTAHTSLNMS